MSKQERKVEWSLDLENLRVRAGQFVGEAMGEPAEVKQETISEPRNGAASARIAIAFALGRATFSALDIDSPLLFQAELRYVGELVYAVSGGADRVISLRQKSSAPGAIAALMNDDEDLHWHIALAPDIPLTLAIKGGVGASEIDLSGLSAKDLKLETGVGQVMLTTPLQPAGFAADIQGGVGKADITIPAGSGAHLKLAGAVGAVSLSVAPEAPVRLRGKSGMGRFSLPANLKRVGGKGASGAWETANFAAADHPIEIDYQGGIGNFSLDHFDAL
jgi:hypothetical protein